MMSYLNPERRSPAAMFDLLVSRGEFSVAHGVSVNVLVAGVSVGVENEFNSQRDLVHLARVTVARTRAQADPPIVVRDPALLASHRRILDAVRAERAALSGTGADFQENANLMFPAAKATAFLMTASLRNLQRLLTGIDDRGKEAEYRDVLARLRDLLGSIWPFLARETA